VRNVARASLPAQYWNHPMSRPLLIALLLPILHAQSTPELPDVPGRALVLRVCTKCHGIEMFANIRMSRDEWKYEVDGMIARGAKATRPEARRIVDYLAKNLGKSQPSK
jgi:hypothetical protein